MTPAVDRHPLLDTEAGRGELARLVKGTVHTAHPRGGGEVTADDLMSDRDVIRICDDIMSGYPDALRHFVLLHESELNIDGLRAHHPTVRVRMAVTDIDDYTPLRLAAHVARALAYTSEA